MTIWDDAFEALADPEAGLTESVIYYASSDAEPQTFPRAVFDEVISPEIADDREGRREPRRALVQLPASASIATDAKAWFVARGLRWRVLKALRERGCWHVTLEALADQTIRRVQRSTRG